MSKRLVQLTSAEAIRMLDALDLTGRPWHVARWLATEHAIRTCPLEVQDAYDRALERIRTGAPSRNTLDANGAPDA